LSPWRRLAIGDNAGLPSPTTLAQHDATTTMIALAKIAAHPALASAVLLMFSNLFMTVAWYGHLKNLRESPWWTAALVSWGIALFEYLLQVPANRIGYKALSLPQLKILQEVITLSVFAPFAVLYMNQPIKLDYLWAGLCLLGAVYFVFRG
jgi:uncharacterized protein (DUF486 family)